MKLFAASIAALAFAAASAVAAPSLAPAAAPAGLIPAPAYVGGRVVRAGAPGAETFTYQWPGTYFETAFTGTELYFKIGPGDVILHVSVDGQPFDPLVKPAPGDYRISDLSDGIHTARIEVATESQAGPDRFDGFFLTAGEKPGIVGERSRAMEFIGDSHTVGYGNTSTTRDCTEDKVWATTDDTQAFGPLIARHYGAEYRVNAISGRGIVRNYDNFPADHLPQVYPYLLFDKAQEDRDTHWQPQVVVIALGTNDFSTQLKPGEPWKTREELHADYEKTYVAFFKTLRERFPKAAFVLWATDMANGEIEAEEGKVVERLKQAGETRISFVPINGPAMTGCNSHPSTADDQTIAGDLIRAIDSMDVWGGR